MNSLLEAWIWLYFLIIRFQFTDVYMKLCLATATNNFKCVFGGEVLIFVQFEIKYLQILMFKHSFNSQWLVFNKLL